MERGNSERIEITISSRFENIELVQVIAEHLCENAGVDEDGSHWIGMAVREAVANAIKHGNAQDPAKQVHVDLFREGDEVVIRVEDEGAGFDPAQLNDPLAPENLLKPNGRGIFYMKSFMDDIHYEPGPGGGTVVILRKKVAGPREGS
jgi:serine/threonine-protein kinase RsbW